MTENQDTEVGQPDEELLTAYVKEEDGTLVLVDPVAHQVARALRKRDCANTLLAHAERVNHFRRRAQEIVTERVRGVPRCVLSDLVIVVLSMDDPFGSLLGDALMPGQGPVWQAFRDEGKTPYARGLAGRSGVIEVLKPYDPDAAQKLEDAKDHLAVLVVDHTVAEVFVE